jgi:hypothetical protein
MAMNKHLVLLMISLFSIASIASADLSKLEDEKYHVASFSVW